MSHLASATFSNRLHPTANVTAALSRTSGGIPGLLKRPGKSTLPPLAARRACRQENQGMGLLSAQSLPRITSTSASAAGLNSMRNWLLEVMFITVIR